MASIRLSLLMVVVVSLLLQHGRGAPSVFLVHPLLITSDAQLAIQGHPRLFLADAGHGSVVDQQSQVTQVEDYDEGVEESRDWKEDDESENETGINSEAQETNDYTEKSEQVSEMEENKDDSDDGSYHENNETEENTEGANDSDDGSYHGNDETEEKIEEKLEDTSDSNHEKEESADNDQEKDSSGNVSDDGLYHENDESDEKTEGQEMQGDASDSDDGSYHENDESGNNADQEKYDSDDGSYHESDQVQSTHDSHDEQDQPKSVSENRQGKAEKGEGKIDGVEIGINHKEQTNPESKRDTLKANEETEIKGNADKSPVGEEVGKDNKAAKPLHVPEEIVIGSIDKAQVEVSKSQNVPVAAKGSDVKDSSAAVKLNPPLKETEEVQLAPVVYHVSPKLQQDAGPPATAA